MTSSSLKGAAAAKARLGTSLATNEQLVFQRAASDSLLVEATMRLEQTKSAHESELTAQGLANAATAAEVARGQGEYRKKVANELAETNSLVVQVAHEVAAAATKHAHEVEIVSFTRAYSASRDARATDAERTRASTEQDAMLTTAKVSAAEFKTRSESLVEGHGALRTELVGATERARVNVAATRLGGIELLRLERVESRRRDDEHTAGTAISTSSNLNMVAMMQQRGQQHEQPLWHGQQQLQQWQQQQWPQHHWGQQQQQQPRPPQYRQQQRLPRSAYFDGDSDDWLQYEEESRGQQQHWHAEHHPHQLRENPRLAAASPPCSGDTYGARPPDGFGKAGVSMLHLGAAAAQPQCSEPPRMEAMREVNALGDMHEKLETLTGMGNAL